MSRQCEYMKEEDDDVTDVQPTYGLTHLTLFLPVRLVGGCTLSVASVLLVLVLTIVNPTLISARSNGDLSSCDLSPSISTTVYKTDLLFPYGQFGTNKTAPLKSSNTIPMKWADAPTPTTFYTLRTSDDATPADDVTYYTPGRTTTLHLRVKDIRRRWIGLVLYATNVTQTGNATSGPGKQNDNQVGVWTLPPDSSSSFHIIACGQTRPNGQVVTHVDADPKPLHTRFYFTAPAGTGKVTIKMLIKQGEQNKGSFFYLSPSLTLTEGAAAPSPPAIPTPVTYTTTNEPVLSKTLTTQYVVGDAGAACANVCLLKTPATPYCHSTSTLALSTPISIDSALAGSNIVCRLPLLQGCPYAGAAYVNTDGYCSYRLSTVDSCPQLAYSTVDQVKTPPPNVCFSQAGAQHRPICACTNDRSQQPVNPYAPKSNRRLLSFDEKEYEASSAFRASMSMISSFTAVALVAFSMMSKPRSVWFFVMVSFILVIAQPTQAHNYIKTVHRAREAAVSVPCQVRISNQPHVQVAAGQNFEVEWALGHPDQKTPYYFATVREEDYMQLAAANITAIITDYLKRAPQNASAIPVGWNRVHLNNLRELNLPEFSYAPPAGPSNMTILIPQYFDVYNISKSHPEYKARDSIYKSKAHPSSYKEEQDAAANFAKFGPVAESTYKPQHLAKDMRASYKSDLYPWISSAAIFWNSFQTFTEHYVVVDQADMAQFNIPSWAGTGNHVLYFNWAGYKDCVDINVMSTTVVNRYGLPTNTSEDPRVVRKDHCEVTYLSSAYTQTRKVNRTTMDVSQCITDCRKNPSCQWVNVVRATNLATTLSIRPNIPYVPGVCNGSIPFGVYQPCCDRSVDMRIMWNETLPGGCSKPYSGCNQAQLALASDDYVCYGTQAWRDQDFQVEEDYRISNEPEDPIFYSTCFYMDANQHFLNTPDITYDVPDWRSGDKCVSCAFQKKLASSSLFQVPKWEDGLTTQCGMCEEVNSNSTMMVWDSILAGADLTQAGRKDAMPYTAPTSSSTAVASSSTATSPTAQSSTATSTSSTAQSSTGAQSSTATSSGVSSTAQPSSTATSSTGGSSSTSVVASSTGTVETQAVKMTVRLIIDWNTVDSDAFKTSFVNSISSALKVLASRISIVAEHLASATDKRSSRALLQTAADIDFMILPSSDGSGPTVSAAAQDFTNQLANSNSALIMSPVGSYFDKTAAAQQVGVNQCSDGSYVTPCPLSADNTNDDTNGSSSSGLSTMTLALIIVGAIVGVLIFGVILFFIVKSCAASSSKQTTMSKMAADSQVHRASTV